MADEDKPGALGLDFLTQIINVHWGGGLAVEFGDKDQDAPSTEPAET
jgi:hypothetical protein